MNYLLPLKRKKSLQSWSLSIVLMFSMILTIMPSLSVSAAEPDNGLDSFGRVELDVVLMSLTRTAANALADPGNQFDADYGVFADESNLTAWNNNTQRVIGYQGSNRTPIVFNNAAAGAWQSVGTAAVDAGITVDTASAFQIKFETTGYENIRFSARQKSTGSGPESFMLAYSIESPTGPYIVIPDSRNDNVRVGNDTYAALQHSYVDFELPAELDNQTVVYLRVFMVDSALSNRSNGNTSINDIVIIGDATSPIDLLTDVELMTLTRTTATLAEAGNQFSADSGVFADLSNLTAWDNNTQITIGGTGRTPIVINNAATVDLGNPWRGWKPAGGEGIGVDNASAFQLRLETTGFENIRFSARQKSTGSGPDVFELAYSIGSPTGPFTVIAGSRTGNIQAPSSFRNDNYSDLDWPGGITFSDFLLPEAISDQSEVYLRIFFNGSHTLGRNGNTSINDIVIIGDEIGGGGNIVVNKTALYLLIEEVLQKVESDYTATTWAVFAEALENALTVANDINATQSEVNSARSRLLSAMNGLTLLSDYVELIDWPGDGTVTAWDTTRTFLADSSGLDFHDGRLYAVDNGTGRLWILDVALDGTLSFVPGFENGKRVRFYSRESASGPDAEGVTVDGDGFVYIASERDNSRSSVNWNVILQVDPWVDANELVALREWDITNSLPPVAANAGIEAVEWVSNAHVAGKLFDQNTNAPFNPANYPGAIADGVFFVALEANGHVYAYVLYDDETFVQIADINSRLGGAMALDYDEYENVLWVKADNTQGNRSAVLTFNGTPNVGIVHVNPPSGLAVNGNFEGFAIAEARYTVNGQRPVYHFEDGSTSRSLHIGSIWCDYQEVIAVDKGALAEATVLALTKVEAKYTAASWKLFAASLMAAQQVYADVNATQEQVDAAVVYLTNAMNALVPTPVCDGCVVAPSDAEFLQARAAGILRNGLTQTQLRLSANNKATLTLVIDGREFILATNVNNRNVSGRIELPDGSGALVFDIKGNGSNIKTFQIIKK